MYALVRRDSWLDADGYALTGLRVLCHKFPSGTFWRPVRISALLQHADVLQFPSANAADLAAQSHGGVVKPLEEITCQ